MERGAGDARAAVDIRTGRDESGCPLDDEYGSLRLHKSRQWYQPSMAYWGIPRQYRQNQGEGFMTRGKPVTGELIQWLQTLDPHRSLTGEHGSRYFCAGDPTWKQAVFVAQGDNLVSVR